MPHLRDGSTVEDGRLDRLIEFDEASRAYPVMARLTAVQAPQKPITKDWPVNLWLNQEAEGACVGFGFAHEAGAEPLPILGLTDAYAREQLYYNIQRIDPWAGGAYPGADPRYDGTSVLSGAKYMTSKGFYTGYRWAFSELEVALAVSYLGPVVLGIPWYSAMYKPTSTNYVRPTGSLVGGHCILASGYNALNNVYTLHNSWGKSWGRNGKALIKGADLAKLLSQQGEACIPEGRQLITL